MPNMGYCRMRNTVRDLRDCRDEWHTIESSEEAAARRKLYELCQEIVDTFSEEDLEFVDDEEGED